MHGIHGYRSADKNGEWLTLRDAAAKLGVSHHQIRKLIKAGVLVSAAASSFTIPLAGRSLEVRRSRPDDTTWTPATPRPLTPRAGMVRLFAFECNTITWLYFMRLRRLARSALDAKRCQPVRSNQPFTEP